MSKKQLYKITNNKNPCNNFKACIIWPWLKNHVSNSWWRYPHPIDSWCFSHSMLLGGLNLRWKTIPSKPPKEFQSLCPSPMCFVCLGTQKHPQMASQIKCATKIHIEKQHGMLWHTLVAIPVFDAKSQFSGGKTSWLTYEIRVFQTTALAKAEQLQDCNMIASF